MSLLDFLGGVAGAMPGIYDNIERRDAEERRRKDLADERERLRAEEEARYLRNRQDTLSDRNEQRAYVENSAAAERARKNAELEDAAVGMVAGRNQISPEQVRSVVKGGLLQPRQLTEKQALHAGEGETARAGEETDPDKARKVFSQFNELISASKAGVPAGGVVKNWDEKARRQQVANMTPEQQRQYLRSEMILDGKDPDVSEARIDLYKSRAELAEAQAKKAERAPAGGGGGADERQLRSFYEKRANDAERAVTAATSKLPDLRGSARTEAEARIQELAKKAQALRADADYVIENGAPPPKREGPTDSKPDATTRPAATGAPPANLLKENVITKFKNGERWTLRNGQPVKVD